MSEWTETYDSADFSDLQANVMAVDCLGFWAILAGRRAMCLIDLECPSGKSTRVARQSKWDMACVQWNPHASHAHLFCTACAQRLDMWSWKDCSSQQVCSMKGHSRNISDIDWSPFDVNVIASCSIDSYTHLWDVSVQLNPGKAEITEDKDPKKPSASFQSVVGASQVKWNKVTNNCFATTHEGDVRIWDPRKGNQPVVYMTAHLSKIHGLDWSPTNEYHFATSSQDCTVKFWDYTNPKHNKGMLKSGSPVYRARYTPFGQGLVTVILSTLRRGGENSLFLWNLDSLVTPVHTFMGHSDVVVEFQWRKKKQGSRDYQLVTWSKDSSLKIWRVDPQLQRLCGHDVQDSSENETSSQEITQTTNQNGFTITSPPTNNKYSQSEETTYQQQISLIQEFSLVNQFIPNVNIEIMDATMRTCTVSVGTVKHSVTLAILFPANYPNGEAPTFELSASSGFPTNVSKKLLKVLSDTAQKYVKRNSNCLEPCLRQFANAFENMTVEERKTPDSDTFPMPQPTNKLQQFMPLPFAAFQDYSIPFPRTCGARFNSVGILTCFGRSKEANKPLTGSEKTPKALSDLSVFTSTSRVRSSQSASGFATMFSRSPPTQKAEPVSISMFYMNMTKQRQRTKSRPLKDLHEMKLKNVDKAQKKEKKQMKLDPVILYDTHCLLNIHRQLAENYIIDTDDIEKMCSHNSKMAATVGRKDLVRTWSLVSLMSNPSLKPSPNPDDGPPWAHCPFGRQMLESLLQYYLSIHDIQTIAMLCCVFWNRQQIINPPSIQKSASKSSLEYVPQNYNPYHTVSGMSGLLRSFTKRRRATVDQVREEALKTAQPEDQQPIGPAATGTQPVPSRLHDVTSLINIPAMLTSAMMKVKRSNSWSYEDFSFEDYKFAEETDPKVRAAEVERKDHENFSRLLDPKDYRSYDIYLKVYANILFRWGLRNKSAEILKYVTIPPEGHCGIEFGVTCHYCGTHVRGAKCDTCKRLAFQCSICHIGVRGASTFCLNCGHGGHTQHLMDWFKTEQMCPTGCGCNCIKMNPF